MKKILSLGIASAVLAMTALSASANVIVRTDSEVTNGAIITVDYVVDANTANIVFKTNASGLTLVNASSAFITGAEGETIAISDDMKTFVGVGVGARANEVIFSQTYTVDAKAGEAISINVTDVEPAGISVTPLTVSVKESGGSTTSSDTTSSDTTSSTTSSDTTSSDTASSDTASSTTSSDGGSATTNPPTGVALAVFPAVIAGAAVVVAKKKRG